MILTYFTHVSLILTNLLIVIVIIRLIYTNIVFIFLYLDRLLQCPVKF